MYKTTGLTGEDIKLLKIHKQVTMAHQLSDYHPSILRYIHYRSPELAMRTELSIDVSFSCNVDDNEQSHVLRNELIVPNIFLVRACQIYALVKGSFITSWFTDYILPILYALLAIALFMNAWWQVNKVAHVVFKSSFNQLLMPL